MESIYGTVSATGWRLRIDYSVSQSIANNRSTVSMTLYIYDGTGNSYNENANETYYTLYDSSRVYKPYHYYSKGWYTLGEKEIEVTHNTDGTQSVNLSAYWYSNVVSNYTPASLSVSGNVTLPTIPRKSTLSVPATMTMGTAYTMNITRADSGFTHTLLYGFAGSGGTVDTGLGASVTWTPPTALAADIPADESGTLTLTLITYNGGTEVGRNLYETTLNVPQYTPTVTDLTVTIDNSASATVAGWREAVQRFSKIGYSVTGASSYGASITEYEICIEGTGETFATPSGTSDVLISPSGKVSARVKDGRGKWSALAEDRHITAYAYGLPEITNSAAFRCDSSGNADDSGSYIRAEGSGTVYSVNGHNQKTVQCRWRAKNGQWGSYVTLTDGTASVISAGLSAAVSYEVEISIADSLGNTRTVVYSIPTAAVAFNLRAGGRGAAFGKYAETDHALDLPADWEYCIDRESLIPVGSIVLGTRPSWGSWTYAGTVDITLGNSVTSIDAWKRETSQGV